MWIYLCKTWKKEACTAFLVDMLWPTLSALNYSQIHNSEGAFLFEIIINNNDNKVDKTRECVCKIGIQITCWHRIGLQLFLTGF